MMLTSEPTRPPVEPARLERADHAAESYKKVEADILALPEEQVGRVTADVAQAASIALGALPNLEKLRPEFTKLANGSQVTQALASLQDYAMAAFYAHLRCVPDTADREVPQLIERAKPIREKLLTLAEALVSFDIFKSELVRSIRDGQGNIDTAKDLVALATLYNANWDQVAGKVPFGRELVSEASKVGSERLHAIGAKEVGEVRTDTRYDWLALRARAFRLLMNAYEEVRRATTFVRWYHGDALAFAPSLHATIPKRRKRVPTGEQSQTEADQWEEDPPSAERPRLNLSSDGSTAPGMPNSLPFEM